MNGILLIDKPRNWTSFDVVAKVRGIVRRQTGLKKPKVGHTGTLDPLATGLLVIVIGSYTKRVPQLSKVGKTYEVSMKLGETSTTGDEEGIKTKSNEQRIVSDKELQSTLDQFVGEIEQTPPAYSAIKINGQRAYKLARAGKEVVIEPRKVTIHEIKGVNYRYPEVRFTVKVSSGTYIRTLVEDIGSSLGVGAYMSSLRRIEVGEFIITKAHNIDSLGHDELQLIQ